MKGSANPPPPPTPIPPPAPPGMDVVFHVAAAAPSTVNAANRALMDAINVDGTRNLVEACIRARVPKLVGGRAGRGRAGGVFFGFSWVLLCWAGGSSRGAGSPEVGAR